MSVTHSFHPCSIHSQNDVYDGCRCLASRHMLKMLDPSNLWLSLRLAIEVLESVTFDTIAFRGMSGAFLGPAIASYMGKQMILVRKQRDDSHSTLRVEGFTHANRFVIVDDFMASGDTKAEIIQQVRHFAPEANYVGLLEVSYITRQKIRDTIGCGIPYPLK